jgi:hypothetical protein
MNRSEELERVTHVNSVVWKRRKAGLKALAQQGENWALEELRVMQWEERKKSRSAYQRFKAKRTPEQMRKKWSRAKAEQRAAKARGEAEAEVKRRRLEIEELAAKAATAEAEEAQRQRKSEEERAKKRTLRELKVIRRALNPKLLVCTYREGGQDCRCVVDVKKNDKFLPGMSIEAWEPWDQVVRNDPWLYAGSLPWRRGRFRA